MQVTMIAMTSLDGKLTRGDEPDIQAWRSDADRLAFRHLLWHHEVVIVGRKGYEAHAAHKLRARPGRLYIIMTKRPEDFADEVVPGQREFYAQQPAELLKTLADRGYERVAVVTGGELNGAYLATGLVTDLYLTIEPRIFGQGLAMAGGHLLDVRLQLERVSQLNEQGTLLAHYTIAHM